VDDNIDVDVGFGVDKLRLRDASKRVHTASRVDGIISAQ
jgi:hypothetical protein